MIKLLHELEDAVLYSEGLSDLLGILHDAATSGANSLDNYTNGIWLFSEIAYENKKKLNSIKDRMYLEINKKENK